MVSDSRPPSKPAPSYYYPRLERVRAVHVYQPATPLKAISVWVTDDGEAHRDELTILGIEASIADTYEGPRTRIGTARPNPERFTPRAIHDAGFVAEAFGSQSTRHRVIVWGDELGQPEVIDPEGGGCSNATVIVAPASYPAEWWERRIADAADSIRRKLEIAEPAYLVEVPR